MATIKLRFVGRFVFTESTTAPGELKVVAIDPGRISSIRSAPHQVFATALKNQIDPHADSRRPDFDLIAPMNDVDGRQMEQAVWSLMNSESSLSGNGFAWHAQANMTSLSNLRTLGGRGGVVDTGENVSSVLRIRAGVGRPVALKTTTLESIYVPFGSVDTPAIGVPAARLADMVEIEFLDTATIRIDVKRQGEPGPPTAIQIRAVNPGETAVLSLSNLCGCAPHTGADNEFAALYDAMENPPPLADRLIPNASSSTPFYDIPCYNAAYVSD